MTIHLQVRWMQRFSLECTLLYKASWANHLTPSSFACTAYLVVCFTPLRCAHLLARLLACSLTCSRAHGKDVFVCELNASNSHHFSRLWNGLSAHIFTYSTMNWNRMYYYSGKKYQIIFKLVVIGVQQLLQKLTVSQNQCSYWARNLNF